MSWLPPKDIGIYPTPVVMALYEGHMTITVKFITKKNPLQAHEIVYQKELRHMSIATLLFSFSSFQYVIKWTVFNYIIVIIYR